MPEGHFPAKPLPNPIIYDNDEYADILDDDVLCAMASLGKITLAGQIITPIDPKGVFKEVGSSRPSGTTTAACGRACA
jgi:hypothetical protein